MKRYHRPRRPDACMIAAALLATALIACHDVPGAFGPTPPEARQNAEDLVGAYASRFTNVTRTPKVSYIRLNLGRGTLVPSRVFSDTAVWTASYGDTARVSAYNGAFTGTRYYFFYRMPPDRLDKPADTYHSTRLRRLSKDEFEWTTAADFVVGRATATVLPTVLSRALQVAETRGGTAVRSDYRSSFPRATKALGELYTLDSLRITKDLEGASSIALTVRADPDRLRRTRPSLADYINKYVEGTRLHVAITDRRGAKWFDLSLRNKHLSMRLRSRDGKLAPLDGPVRELPDDLIVRTDFVTHLLLFDIGWKGLVSYMSIVRGSGERAWAIRSTREPDWILPPLTKRFIRTPLKRPFQGNGVYFRVGMRESPDGPTTFYRRAQLTVQESAIIRFLGRLSGTAMSDFYGRSELDENSFNGDVFAALRDDMRAIFAEQRRTSE